MSDLLGAVSLVYRGGRKVGGGSPIGRLAEDLPYAVVKFCYIDMQSTRGVSTSSFP